MAMAASQATTLSFDAIVAESRHRDRLHLLSSSSHPRPFPSSLHKSQCTYPLLSLNTTTIYQPPKSLPPTTTSSSFPNATRTSLSFLDPDDVQRLQLLDEYRHRHVFDDGSSLEVRLMAPEELDATVRLLAESFADSMWTPGNYVALLAFLVKQYLLEKRKMLPHAATVVGIYKKVGGTGDEEAEKEVLAGTAEVSFDALGMSASPPTPPPPRDYPYVCNMTVSKELRRKRIGGHLLIACEELISLMSKKQEVYLHCRVIDQIPYNMYKKSGYHVVKTDTILVWLSFQRRKYLMCKTLPPRDTIESEDADLKQSIA